MADGNSLGYVPSTSLTCTQGQKSTTSGDYYASPDRQFAPVRHGNAASAFTDGRSAMKAMADAIRGAQKFIFIADWQMNYDTEMDGRGTGSHNSRLSDLLYDAINDRGVDVRILLYDSVEAAAYTHENEAREVLRKMQNENTPGSIEIGLHNPATGRQDIFNIAFSHHQKILVVDGSIGFVGGLDIAHGRWDDGNFDVVCDPALHVINDHYNNCLIKKRSMDGAEFDLIKPIHDDSPGGMGRVRPGFAPAYVPGPAIAWRRMVTHWNDGAVLAELQDYIDKLGPEWLARLALDQTAKLTIDGYEEVTETVIRIMDLIGFIKSRLDEAELKYQEVIAASNRSIDELGKGEFKESGRAAFRAADGLRKIKAAEFDEWVEAKKAEVTESINKGKRVLSYFAVPALMLIDGIERGGEALEKLDSALKAWRKFKHWIDTPIDDTQSLLDSNRQPRMPWQDVHAQLQGPAVFDICRNFMHRWNAMLWQNQALGRGLLKTHLNKGIGVVNQLPIVEVPEVTATDEDVLGVINSGIDLANHLPDVSIPHQQMLTRGEELTPLDDAWLQRMGGSQALFGDLTRPGNAGGVSVQILRSSGTALHDMEAKACRHLGLNLNDGSCLQPYWERKQPMASILDAMSNCIASARAFIYLETQFLISDCEWADALPGSQLQAHVKGGRRGELSEAEQKEHDRIGRIPLPQITDAKKFHQGVKSAARNPLVESIARRIRRAIHARQDFHVYITLPVHPEGSIFDGAVVKQQYWVQQTLLRGRKSLIRRICYALVARDKNIREESVEEVDLIAELDSGRWQDYLSVMNLRSYGLLSDKNHDKYATHLPPTLDAEHGAPVYLVTEQCYVHSKLLIVDDAVAIIGSANCNDRSLMGDGDTEIAAVIVDTDIERADLGNGQQVVTRRFARELRQKLWKKFLGESVSKSDGKEEGFSQQDRKLPHPPFAMGRKSGITVSRPAHRSTWQGIRRIASSNAGLYEQVFRCVPRDSMARYDATTRGFSSAGLSDDGLLEIRRFAQPPDLMPDFMRKPSIIKNHVTLKVGVHDITKALAVLKPETIRGGGLVGFWVSMPLRWGHGMDDPAAAMPNEMIAAAPADAQGNATLYAQHNTHHENGERV